jgi:hypothetical protein
MKRCIRCNRDKKPTDFSNDTHRSDGLEPRCKKCEKERKHQIYIADPEKEFKRKKLQVARNPEKEARRQAIYRQNNIEKVTDRNKRYKQLNAEKEAKRNRNWAQKHPDKCNATSAKRRATKLNATPLWLTEEQLAEIKEFYILAKELQWLSDPTDPLQVDHIIPLQGENVCGLHVPWNLQILPKSLNCTKSNKIK